MAEVQISARIIHWPQVCACCCRPADTEIEVSSTRETGKRVVRAETKSWRIPYCQRCLDHIIASRELQAFDDRVVSLTGAIGILGGILAVVVFFLGYRHALLLGILLAALAVAITVTAEVLLYSHFQREYRRKVAAKRRQRLELEERLAALQCGDCACDDQLAASYEGWYGTVQTFWFASEQFAGYFQHRNHGKIVSVR